MSIIAPLPFTEVNGTTADATEVMANFNRIRDDVNANAQSKSGGATGNVGQTCIVAQLLSNTNIPLAGTNIQFDTAVNDPLSFFSLSSPTDITIPSGVNSVKFTVTFMLDLAAGTPSDVHSIRPIITLSGFQADSGLYRFPVSPSDGSAGTVQKTISFCTQVIPCSSGDVFKLKISDPNFLIGENYDAVKAVVEALVIS